MRSKNEVLCAAVGRLAAERSETQTGMGSDFQFWLLFSFYLFSVLSVFHCVFL
jgi:hypothetical protein